MIYCRGVGGHSGPSAPAHRSDDAAGSAATERFGDRDGVRRIQADDSRAERRAAAGAGAEARADSGQPPTVQPHSGGRRHRRAGLSCPVRLPWCRGLASAASGLALARQVLLPSRPTVRPSQLLVLVPSMRPTRGIKRIIPPRPQARPRSQLPPSLGHPSSVDPKKQLTHG